MAIYAVLGSLEEVSIMAVGNYKSDDVKVHV